MLYTKELFTQGKILRIKKPTWKTKQSYQSIFEFEKKNDAWDSMVYIEKVKYSKILW